MTARLQLLLRFAASALLNCKGLLTQLQLLLEQLLMLSWDAFSTKVILLPLLLALQLLCSFLLTLTSCHSSSLSFAQSL